MINNAKSSYYNKQFHDRKGNTASTWKLIREIVPNKTRDSNVNSFDDIIDKADKFNAHFASVRKTTYDKTQRTLHGDNTPTPHDTDVAPCDNEHFKPQPIDTNTVIQTVKALNDTSSVGSDNIPLRFVRDALYMIAYFLTCIINTSTYSLRPI